MLPLVANRAVSH